MVAGALAAGALLALTGCSGSASRGFLPEGATTESERVTSLWNGSWIAALAVGVVVWGLTIWCVVAYRKRKHDTELPDQLRYNLPIEILYTVIPLFMVGVLFFYTQRDESVLVSTSTPSDNVVNVMGKRWGWDFNYVTNNAFESTRQVETDPGNGQEVTQADLPDLYLPVDRVTRFYLTSRDVAHSFWVPAFLMKMDTIPGRVNEFQVRPDRTGTFIGKCAELCGQYHYQMLFEVHVVPQAEYDQHIAQLKASGREGQLPNTLNQSGLEPNQRDQIPSVGSTS
ncbi:cytochrome c oxidase subunit II [Angustibacter aerolatus]